VQIAVKWSKHALNDDSNGHQIKIQIKPKNNVLKQQKNTVQKTCF